MAIYRKGEASLAADGTVTGYGTTWKDQLALIRIGATVVFLSGNEIGAIGTISAIVSDTQIKTIQTDGATVARGKYFILLHDSLTVDGLAQNVAETLRYYQSSESEIAEAMDYFKTFDWDKFEAIAKGVKTNAEAAKVSETNAKASETNAKQSENAAASSKNAAAASQAAAKTSETNAKTSETNAKASENAANGSKVAAAGSATAADSSAKAAAASQAAAKTSETNSKSSETNAKASENSALQSKNAASGSATAAKTSETNAKTSETKAKTSETNSAGSAATATSEADRAKREADRAAAANPDNALLKANNLSDVPNKGQARVNLSVPSVEEIGVSAGGNIKENDANNLKYNGFFAGAGGDGSNYIKPYSPGLVMRRVNSVFQLQGDAGNGDIWTRYSVDGTTWGGWTRFLKEGDFGFGTAFSNTPGGNWGGMFISDANGSTDWAPSNGAGFQMSYAANRGAQVWVDNTGRLHSRFNMTSSPQATKAAAPWKRTLNDDDIGNFEKAGGGLGTLGLGDASLRGNGHGVYYQPMSANATPARGYPTNQAGSFRVEQNGANGANGCVQFYTPYTGVGGTYFRFLGPDGVVLVPGGPSGWKMNLTNNGDVAGGNSPTISDYNNFASNHVGFGYGNVANSSGTGGVVNTISNTKFADYKSMSCHDYNSGRLFFRTFNADAVKSWTPWKEVTFLAASDINLKEVKGNMNVNGALDNVCRMDFKLFRYLDDTPDRSARRGVIAQQVQKIDREYVKQVGDYLHLDQTPMLLDGLAAIKALKKKDDDNKERISKLESEVEELKAMVAALIAK